ncbi:hypothetical protein SFRURICE_000629 [Spodoptera frugiperda]|nr:hypothetical protein SFRURICE_000629 [Spodoptera frugiperda]
MPSPALGEAKASARLSNNQPVPTPAILYTRYVVRSSGSGFSSTSKSHQTTADGAILNKLIISHFAIIIRSYKTLNIRELYRGQDIVPENYI